MHRAIMPMGSTLVLLNVLSEIPQVTEQLATFISKLQLELVFEGLKNTVFSILFKLKKYRKCDILSRLNYQIQI